MDIIKDTSNKAIKDNIFSLNNEIFATSRTSYPYSFVLKKTEKISAALYLLTNDLNEGEPIRLRLRSMSIILVEEICRLMPGNRECLMRVAETIDALKGVLSVAANANVLHPALVVILAEELNGVAVTVEEAFATPARHGFGALSGSEYFNVEVFNEGVVESRPKPASLSEKIKDNQTYESARDAIPSAGDNVQYNTKGRTELEKDKIDVRKKDRRAVILTILQTKERITVKELGEVIKDCSEKTLQRELLALVAQGVLKKEGERRWSSYSIR